MCELLPFAYCLLQIGFWLLNCPRMKKRNVLVPLLVLALVFVVFLIRRWNEPRRKEAFERNPARVVYSHFARCQMACRNISKEEVEELMQKGIINFTQSNRMASPCPKFALQGRTESGKSLRVFFLQCPEGTRVLSCKNLKESTACICPADAKKEEQ